MIAHDVPVARPITRGLARAAGGVLAGKGRTAGAIALAMLIFASAGPAQAQSRQETVRGVEPACEISEEAEEHADNLRSDPAQTTLLVASCSGTGLVLGQADRFEVFSNAATGAVVVAMERLGRSRIVLLQRGADGPSAEIITGDLARALGRPSTDSLRDVTPDYSHFADDGVITISTGQELDQFSARSGAGRPAFSLAEHNALLRDLEADEASATAGGAQ